MNIKESRDDLVHAIVRKSRLLWYVFTAVLTAVLLLYLVLSAVMDGTGESMGSWNFWREFLGAPLIIAYIFLIYPYMSRLSRNAVDSIRKLQISGGSTTDSVPAFTVNRGLEWAAFLAGIIIWVLLLRPWNWEREVDGLWLYSYTIISFSLLFGLLGWLIYGSIAESRYLNRLSRRKLDLDVFNTSAMIPVGRASLGTSFAFLGGISISLIFQTVSSLQAWSTIIIYAILVAATLLIFFLSIWSIHRIMATTRNNELSLARAELEKAIRRLRDSTIEEKQTEPGELHSAVAAWGTYERHIREVPVWPFNADILRRLAVSALVPAAVYLLKIFLGVRIFG